MKIFEGQELSISPLGKQYVQPFCSVNGNAECKLGKTYETLTENMPHARPNQYKSR
jgi:hypothetical protein